MFDLRYLLDFVDLARTGNFSATARNRSISQPALTRRIQQLEEWAARLLIDRSKTPLRLTSAGEEFLPIAERIAEELESFRRRSRDDVAAPVRCMSIHSLASWARHAAYAERAASIAFGNYDQCFAALRDNATDVALVCHTDSVRDARFRGLARARIGVECFIAVASREYTGERQQPAVLIELARDNYLGNALAAVVETCKRGSDYVIGSVAHRIDAVRGLVEAGAGIGLLPESMIRSDLSSGHLRRIEDAALEVPLDVVLIAASEDKLEAARDLIFHRDQDRKANAPLTA